MVFKLILALFAISSVAVAGPTFFHTDAQAPATLLTVDLADENQDPALLTVDLADTNQDSLLAVDLADGIQDPALLTIGLAEAATLFEVDTNNKDPLVDIQLRAQGKEESPAEPAEMMMEAVAESSPIMTEEWNGTVIMPEWQSNMTVMNAPIMAQSWNSSVNSAAATTDMGMSSSSQGSRSTISAKMSSIKANCQKLITALESMKTESVANEFNSALTTMCLKGVQAISDGLSNSKDASPAVRAAIKSLGAKSTLLDAIKVLGTLPDISGVSDLPGVPISGGLSVLPQLLTLFQSKSILDALAAEIS